MNRIGVLKRRLAYGGWIISAFLLMLLLWESGTARADHTPSPSAVTIAGSLQSELGCAGDWDPTCAATHLTFDSSDDVWQGTFAVPAGAWEYKAAINNNWDENYGANAAQNGANIPLSLAGSTSVRFYYDHKSHWITDNQNSVIVTAPGSFQSELGCPGDWQPDCLRSWLQDPDGDGIFTLTTTAIPAGAYEVKAAINESWDENYGQGGVPNGPNIPFTVAHDGQEVTFHYDPVTHVLRVTVADDIPPTITMIKVTPSSLWPPNHKLVPVRIAVSVEDNSDSSPVCGITSVSSNEPVNGLGDGDTAPDWIVTGELAAKLRAERGGRGHGRVYTITVMCLDASGNSATGSTTVTVPHDKGKGKGKKKSVK